MYINPHMAVITNSSLKGALAIVTFYCQRQSVVWYKERMIPYKQKHKRTRKRRTYRDETTTMTFDMN